MRVISVDKLVEFSQIHPDAEVSLDAWRQVAESAQWKHIIDVRHVYPHADFVEGYTVFNIGGNKYRLITKITYLVKTVTIKCVLTHSEYDKNEWKK